MTTWTDSEGRMHILFGNGDHYVARGTNYEKLPA